MACIINIVYWTCVSLTVAMSYPPPQGEELPPQGYPDPYGAQATAPEQISAGYPELPPQQYYDPQAASVRYLSSVI